MSIMVLVGMLFLAVWCLVFGWVFGWARGWKDWVSAVKRSRSASKTGEAGSMSKSNLEKIQDTFDADEDTKEMVLIGQLPTTIAAIAAEAMENKDGQSKTYRISLGSTEPYMHIARLIQERFFPSAPQLEAGGFSKMLAGGPMPAWVVIRQVAMQITDKAREHGHYIPESEVELLANK